MVDKINLKEKFDLFAEHWQPKIAAELNDSYVKLAKFKGEFTWHKHDHEDEMFLVITGHLTIKLRDGVIELDPGEFCVIPKGIEHMPVAEEEVQVLLLEPKTVVNTGDKQTEHTVKELDWI